MLPYPSQLSTENRHALVVAVSLHDEWACITKRTQRCKKTFELGIAGTQHHRAATQYTVLDVNIGNAFSITREFY